MRFTMMFGAMAIALLALPAMAQDDADRSALQRALASVNEGDEDEPFVEREKPGFFGRGFTITAGETDVGVGGARFGLRDNSERDKERVDGIRIINR